MKAIRIFFILQLIILHSFAQGNLKPLSIGDTIPGITLSNILRSRTPKIETSSLKGKVHLVSHVSRKLLPGVSSFKIVADTFPAGTLSGAPKFRAMEIIDENEKSKRSFYSGAIGFLGFNGDFNHAIMIRSFLSKNNTLHYQAGAGIVADSNPESELKEVDNKITALRKAIELAEAL